MGVPRVPPTGSAISAVSRILYAVAPARTAAGCTSQVLLLSETTGRSRICTQVAKLSTETWRVPVQEVLETLVVTLAGTTGRLKVTRKTGLRATAVAPSAGTVVAVRLVSAFGVAVAGSDGSPSPAELRAETTNLYACAFNRPMTSALVVVEGTSTSVVVFLSGVLSAVV